ncbi:DEAD/DEAH box helicase family protein [Candidatus Magnetaquicoccus inordinatus]|uniref:DEAD/DEAH box helicase family protein n=1 Tax=Candidatus Magnetaquicoccus inordinatus TaxID=2496818 RepID=UPI003B967F48
MMKSLNFEFLRPSWPQLAELGGFAESYAHPDPGSSLVKLRAFAEQLVLWIYDRTGFSKPYQPNLNDLLNESAFTEAVPKAVVDKLHAIRIHGNKAAHGEKASTDTALWLLKESHAVGQWIFMASGQGKTSDLSPYQDPPSGGLAGEARSQLKREKKAVLEQLAAQEAQMRALLEQLDTEREKAQTAELKTGELEALIQSGRNAANVLNFDEATTRRRLIDSQLVMAGWKVAANGGNTDEVTQEEEVEHQPTQTGKGYADYVLWNDDGKPLAVVEAKKTSRGAEQGRKQAQLYADGLEKMYGQRPVIFITNGFDLWIWDDASGYSSRKLYGFYSKDSLQYLVTFQRNNQRPLDELQPSGIAGRLYQLEAIKRVCERFTARHRRALVVQATGTGKTRVAISLTDLLIRAGWVKRVLFLCDRKELRKQAKNAYIDFLNEPLVVVGRHTAQDRDKRIYLATYPAMMKIFETFDVGFFDLIIADESHRSIYNRYRDLFSYFDALQVGLTATPVGMITRNTYRLFGCEDDDPTFNYDFSRAVEEGHLVPFELFTHTTEFLRLGIKYENLSEAQRQQLEEDGEDPGTFAYEAQQIDKAVFNRDTNKHVLRNLMENGLRESTGTHPGKSILFARNHNHAVLLSQLFDELYPQYGGGFCQVIDNYDPRAEQLIDDFKGIGSNPGLTIAISVDMLDTGIDIPEVVNLVFAKPVKSRVKFWQMIGRGTRLCPAIGKTKFRIFDHWGNFEFFSEEFQEADPAPARSLMQQVFEARIDLAETALEQSDPETFKLAAELIGKDLAALPEETIAVREKWREKRTVQQPHVLEQFAPETVGVLRQTLAPLMQWIDIRDHAAAWQFDRLIAMTQNELLKSSSRFEDYRDQVQDQVAQLQMHLNPVREKGEVIKRCKDPAFWSSVTVADLENLRRDLRGVMHHRRPMDRPGESVRVVDVTDGGIAYTQRMANMGTVDLVAYRKRVEEVLMPLFESNPTLKKIRAGVPVTETDLNALNALIHLERPDVDLNILKEFYHETAQGLEQILRSIIGMDGETVEKHFADFVRRHPTLNARQIRFLGLLKNHISKFGVIAIDRLYEPPFTTVDSEGPDGVFREEAQMDDLIAILDAFKPPAHFEKRASL